MWTKAWENGGFDDGIPGMAQWLKIVYDHVSQRSIYYGIRASSTSIYATDTFFYDSTTHTFPHLSGTGSLGNVCPADAPSMPGDRHPVGQMTVDTRRNVMWLWGGVCNSVGRSDTYTLSLNANFLTDSWTQRPATHFVQYIAGSGIYDPDDDVVFHFGFDGGPNSHSNWLYCPTDLNPTVGTLTAKQTAAGCTLPDDWNDVPPAGGVVPMAGSFFPGLVYDTVNKKVILCGGYAGGPGPAASETWVYDVPTRTWVNRNPSTHPIFVNSPERVVGTPLAFNSSDGKVYFINGSTPPETWTYTYATNQWTLLCNNCSTPANPLTIAYDKKTNRLIALNYGGVQHIEMWEGTLTGTVATQPSCDQNGDGTVNVLDVQLAVAQVLGTSTCTTVDLDGNGACSVVDLQRIITAALGGSCHIGL